MVGKDDLGWDVAEVAAQQQGRSIVEVFSGEINDFSKYRLAKAFIRWTRDHEASELSNSEREQWETLVGKINSALR
jgi:hypothetical protein